MLQVYKQTFNSFGVYDEKTPISPAVSSLIISYLTSRVVNL